MNNGRRHSFGRGEHHCAGVDGPVLLTRTVGPARPDIDDRPPVDVHRERATAEPAAREQTCEHADRTGEPRIGCTPHTAGQPFFGTEHRRLRHKANIASSTPPCMQNRNIQPPTATTTARSWAPAGPSRTTSLRILARLPSTVNSPGCGWLPPRTSYFTVNGVIGNGWKPMYFGSIVYL